MVRSLVALALALTSGSGVPHPVPQAAEGGPIRDLPIVELPPRRAGRLLAVFLTGDGGWADLDRTVAGVLADSGIAVVAMNSRAYLKRGHGPDDAARDVARLATHYMTAWGRDRLVLVGYSRGADMAPFVATRLPAELRTRLTLVAMLGVSQGASFRFHLLDLIRDVQRPTDLPILPELERLRGTPMLCVYGAGERHSACRDAPPSLLTREERKGNHHFDGDYEAIGALIAAVALR